MSGCIANETTAVDSLGGILCKAREVLPQRPEGCKQQKALQRHLSFMPRWKTGISFRGPVSLLEFVHTLVFLNFSKYTTEFLLLFWSVFNLTDWQVQNCRLCKHPLPGAALGTRACVHTGFDA